MVDALCVHHREHQVILLFNKASLLIKKMRCIWLDWGRAEEGKRETLLYENIWGRAEVKSNGNINKLQFDGTIHYQWVPRSHSIYQYAIEN